LIQESCKRQSKLQEIIKESYKRQGQVQERIKDGRKRQRKLQKLFRRAAISRDSFRKCIEYEEI
jgi:hypothetical protein